MRRDEDLLKYHEQEAQMDALLSALRKANQLEETSEREANELRTKLRLVQQLTIQLFLMC